MIDRALKTARQKKLPRPVISVGNISVGGTRKTPLVIKLLSDLKSWGLRPAVLMRGYGSKNNFSDEAALFNRYHPDVPVGAAPDRYSSAQEILKSNKIDVFVLDDGFQHWLLHRDLDLVCIDSTAMGDHLLPWGRLREPQQALQRAQLVIATRLELLEENERHQQLEVLNRTVTKEKVIPSLFRTIVSDWKGGQTFVPSELKGLSLVAVSAIGRPQAFEHAFARMGAKIFPLRFRDHHHYTEEDLKKIEETALKFKADVITTEKDIVKLERITWGMRKEFPFRIFVASVDHEFSPVDENKWKQTIQAALRKYQ